MERKEGTIALHTRNLPKTEQDRLTEIAESVFGEIQTFGFDWLSFDGGVELRARGRSKASAVEEILSSEPRGVPAAYLGDDLTDEEGFAALAGRGLRVLVREELRSTAADLWLRPPNELLAFLDRWLEAVCATGEDLHAREPVS
jgi:trehalose-phosphatase